VDAPAWRPAYIGLGGNLDRPRDRVLEAVGRIGILPHTRVELRSRLYMTQPLGPQDQPHFVNAVAGVLTSLGARELLDALLGVERLMGRMRQARWGPRIIDLDLLWMSGAPVGEPGLDLPHPGVSMRNFVLYPLFDIAPTLTIPGLGRVADLKARVGGDGIAVLDEP
jgi:2-amino-4-hydroxy-6-hydroxymethyldihydropteridine diphosphokinase